MRRRKFADIQLRRPCDQQPNLNDRLRALSETRNRPPLSMVRPLLTTLLPCSGSSTPESFVNLLLPVLLAMAVPELSGCDRAARQADENCCQIGAKTFLGWSLMRTFSGMNHAA